MGSTMANTAIQCLQEFANAIHKRGAPLTNCWGFIDGTVRPMSRPGQHQRVVYNGHKRVHALKFQSVVAPNGLIANLYGPVGKAINISYAHKCIVSINNY